MLAKNLIVHGASRFLNTLYANDLTVGGTTTFSTLDVTGAANIAGTLTLSKSQDASGTADNKPALIVGSPTGAHLELDTNEIMAKASATTTAALTINNDGGGVYIAPKGTTYMGNGSKIYATDGTFTAVSYNGTNYTGTNATFDSGKITNLMVTDTLRSFKWDIDHVANLGGNFLVTPSIIFESGKTAQVTRSGSTLTISITDSGITSLIGGIAWTANSTIKAAGKINNIAIGNCDGTITSINASTNTMIIQVTSGADVSGFATTATSYTIQELTVMLTKVSGTNPIGIYMTASDPNAWPATDSQGKASISIYGGTAPGTGMTATTPVARLGYLGGLPAINGVTPSGWGLYTNHGYFSGLIVSNQGKIGNFTISNALYSSTHSAYNTNVDGVYLGSDYISVGKQGAAYLKADGTGKIGRYTFASNGEFTTTVSNNTAGMGNATYAFWAGATSANAANAPFSVTYAGAIKSTSGTIGGYTIDATSLYSGTKGNSTTSGHFTLTTGTFTRAIDGTSRSNLQMALGAKFGVANDGTLYANGANITNINASNIKTGTLSADVIDAGSIEIGKLAADVQTSLSNANTALNRSVEYIIGTQTASTNAWTGVTTDTAIYAGKTIAYYLPFAGNNSAATLNLTLAGGGTTGAKNVRINNSNVTTHYNQYSVIKMTFDGTYWKTDNYDTYDRTRYNVTITTNVAIAAGRIGVFGTDGYLKMLGTTSSDMSFDFSKPIIYVGTEYKSGAMSQTNNYTCYMAAFTLTNTHAVTGAAAGKPVYIVGTLSGTTFTPTSTVLTCTEPASADNLYYIRLGVMTSTTKAVLEAEHPLYAFMEGEFQRVDTAATKCATNYITYIDSTDGIKVHNADDLTDYVQVNSSAISFFRNNSERTKIEDAAVRVGGIGSNIRNVYITNSAVQIRNNTSVLAEYGSTISLYQPGTTTKAVEITSTGVNVANGVLSGSKLETGEANRLYVEINHGIPSEAVDDTAKVKLSVEPGNIRAVTNNTAYARIRHAKFYGTTWDGWNINEYGWYMTPFVYCKQLFMDSGEAIGFSDFEHGLYNMRNDIMDSINESTSKLVTDNVISGINFVGSRRLGIATLTFVNFKFPANTDPSTTAYRIPYGTHKDYYPNEKLDFVSTYITNHTTNNWGRFYVTTDGYIRPVIKPTSDMAIRGTFVYTFY